MNSYYIPDYTPLTIKGSGSFRYVVEALDKKYNVKVAIKRTHKVSREYEILTLVRDCKYYIQLYDIFYTKDEKNRIIQNLVFETVHQNLGNYSEQVRKQKKFIPLDKIKKITRQLLLGLNFFHKKNIVHRDLKPENILFTTHEQVKICDFESSKILEYKIEGGKKK